MTHLQDSPVEEWRPIPGFPGYEASNLGRIRSWWERARGRLQKGRHLAGEPRILIGHARPQCGNYILVHLTQSGQKARNSMLVHRLVLLAFVGTPPEDKPHCCHQDGNPQNNALSNLAWGSAKENIHDKIRHGTMARGERNGRAKVDASEVREIRRLGAQGESAAELAKRFGMTATNVRTILSGQTWKRLNDGERGRVA